MAIRDDRYFTLVPLGQLLHAFKLQGISISPECYEQAIKVVEFYFPKGLLLNHDGGQWNIDECASNELRLLLRTVVAKTQAGQQLYDTAFKNFSDWRPIPAIQAFEDRILPASVIDMLKRLRVQQADFRRKIGKKRQRLKLVFRIALTLNACMLPAVASLLVSVRNQLLNLKAIISYSANGKDITFQTTPALPKTGIVKWVFAKGDTLVPTSPDRSVHHNFPPGTFPVKFFFTSTNSPVIAAITGRRITALSDSATVTTPLSQDSTLDTGNNNNVRFKHLLFKKAASAPIINISKGNTWIWLLLIFAVLCVIMLSWLARSKKRNIRRNVEPPLRFKLPNREDQVKTDNALLVWAKNLNQREAGQHFNLDVRASLVATIKNADIATLHYHPVSRQVKYLFLIDYNSAHQATDSFLLFVDLLQGQGLHITTYLFRDDPRVCWNSKNSVAVPTSSLAINYADHRLVIFSLAGQFVSPETATLNDWVTELFSPWLAKAIVLPIATDPPPIVKLQLQKLCRVFTADMRGFAELTEAFQLINSITEFTADELKNIPVFTRQLGNGERIKYDELKNYISHVGGGTNTGTLLQWACATVLYPLPSWEVTLAIGETIAKYKNDNSLLLFRNLLIVTSLPWLKFNIVPDEVRDELLPKIDAPLKAAAVTAVQKMLTSGQLAELPPGSAAFQEREVRLLELEAHSGRTLTKQQYQQINSYKELGMVRDNATALKVASWERKRTRNWGLLSVLLFLAGISSYWIPGMGGKTSTVKLADSASYFNNLAADIYAQDTDLVNRQTYLQLLRSLDKAIKIKPLFEAYYNMAALKSNTNLSALVGNQFQLETGFTQVDMTTLDSILKPLISTYGQSGKVASVNFIRSYLSMLQQKLPANVIERYIRLNISLDSVSDSPIGILPQFKNTIETAIQHFPNYRLSYFIDTRVVSYKIPYKNFSALQDSALLIPLSHFASVYYLYTLYLKYPGKMTKIKLGPLFREMSGSPKITTIPDGLVSPTTEAGKFWVYLGQIVNGTWTPKYFVFNDIPVPGAVVLTAGAVYKRDRLPIKLPDGTWKLGGTVGTINDGTLIKIDHVEKIEDENYWALAEQNNWVIVMNGSASIGAVQKNVGKLKKAGINSLIVYRRGVYRCISEPFKSKDQADTFVNANRNIMPADAYIVKLSSWAPKLLFNGAYYIDSSKSVRLSIDTPLNNKGQDKAGLTRTVGDTKPITTYIEFIWNGDYVSGITGTITNADDKQVNFKIVNDDERKINWVAYLPDGKYNITVTDSKYKLSAPGQIYAFSPSQWKKDRLSKNSRPGVFTVHLDLK